MSTLILVMFVHDTYVQLLYNNFHETLDMTGIHILKYYKCVNQSSCLFALTHYDKYD